MEAETLRPVASFATNVLDVALSRDGATLAVLEPDEVLRVFDVPGFRERCTVRGLPANSDLVLVSHGGDRVAVPGSNGITFWDARNGNPEGSIAIRARQMSISTVAAAPDWSLFLTSGTNSLFLWEPHRRSLVAELPGHQGDTYCSAFSPDGQWLATGGWENRGPTASDLSPPNERW